MSDKINDLSEKDRVWLAEAEKLIEGYVSGPIPGFRFHRDEKDLECLQILIETNAVGKDHLLEAQCIGVVLGNLITETTSMEWKRVINEYGDMIALHSREIGFTLYPLTMISQRLEDEIEVDLVALYRDLAQSLGLSEAT